MNRVQDISMVHRFNAETFDDREINIILGSLNCYGRQLGVATKQNLQTFTWEQVKRALVQMRAECKGDSRDDVDDVIYNLRAAMRELEAEYV